MAAATCGNPGKDFDTIAADYRFFEEHSTEADAHAGAVLEAFRRCLSPAGPGRLLDFGCGSGTFTELVLDRAGWDPASLRLVLVEPAEVVRAQAVTRVRRFSHAAVVDGPDLPAELSGGCGAVLANHVLYYVPDLAGTVERLVDAVAPGGVLVASLAPRANPLVRIWVAAFGAVGREVPFHTSEDLARVLDEAGLGHEVERVVSELSFADTEANRRHIVRFLLADHLDQVPLDPVMAEIDRYGRGGRIEMPLVNDQYVLRR